MWWMKGMYFGFFLLYLNVPIWQNVPVTIRVTDSEGALFFPLSWEGFWMLPLGMLRTGLLSSPLAWSSEVSSFVLRDSINQPLWVSEKTSFFCIRRLASWIQRNHSSYLPLVFSTFSARLSYTEKYQEATHEWVWQKYKGSLMMSEILLTSFYNFKKPCALLSCFFSDQAFSPYWILLPY
jgi:hypothetical protein